MGCQIKSAGGPPSSRVGRLTARLKAGDLRAGAALVIAGLVASGTTEIEGVSYIERGYENIVEKLRALGADISAVTIPDSLEIAGLEAG